MYGCERWTIKKAECWKTDPFELWCQRRLLRVPWTTRRSNQSILKEIGPEYSLEGLMLKLKLQYFGHLSQFRPWGSESVPDAAKDWRQETRKTEDKMVGWHHRLDGHEFEQAPVVGDGQGSLPCCSPWGCKESDMTEWLNWTEGSNCCFLTWRWVSQETGQVVWYLHRWYPTPALLPGKSHGRRSLVGRSPWGC